MSLFLMYTVLPYAYGLLKVLFVNPENTGVDGHLNV